MKIEISKEDKKALKALIKKFGPKEFKVEDFCFDKQKAFVSDKSPWATACCGRRAGKTLACCADLVSTALSRERINCLYITLNRLSAKRIIWPDLLRINTEYQLGAKVNESELTMTFPNGSVIYISGAKDASEIEKFRGMALALAYLDEVQSFRSHIESLVDDVIAKALFDYGGRLRLIGTPGPVTAGYFWDSINNPNYKHYNWTMFDNPWLPIKSGMTHEEILQRELDRKGLTRDNPGIRRECFGEWAYDPDALVFKYNEGINHFNELPQLGNDWNYVLGVDLGFIDNDAICALAWNERSPQLFLVEEVITEKQGVTELAQQLETLVARYNPTKIVMDTGGLGKKIAEEITKRFAIPVHAAEKVRKFEYIELLNDAMRTRKFMAKKDSQFAHDCKMVEWDRDEPSPDKLKIKDTYHSDICDAVLYAFREAYHWTHKPEAAPIKPYTERWYKNEQEMMWHQAWEQQKAQEHDEDLYYEEV